MAAPIRLHKIHVKHQLNAKSNVVGQPEAEDPGGNLPAVLLVGGFGTRLQSVVQGMPKPLAPVGKKSFLHLLVRQLQSQGIRDLVMCTGYLSDQIEKELGDGRDWGVAIRYSKESQPLGTGGAVKLAERYLPVGSDFLVMNGDSFLELDFGEFIRFHRKHPGVISMAVRGVSDAARYGTVQLDSLDRVVDFHEKTGDHVPGIVNGGIYLFDRAVLKHIPDGPASLEKDVFPHLLTDGIYAFEQHGLFIDIGTPEDYARAQELCDSLDLAALRESSRERPDR